MTAGDAVAAERIGRGTPAFLRINLALTAAGFATFALLYAVQPLLPLLAASFRLTAARSSLVLSLATFTLAVAMLGASALSEAVGRRPVMTVSLVAASALQLACAAAPNWHWLLWLRAVQGVAFSGLPAVAMAYVSEEVDPPSAVHAIGLYIAGSALGGMTGRVLAGLISDVAGWRAALGGVGVLGVVAAAIFCWLLPASRHFHARPLRVEVLARGFARHLRDAALLPLFAEGFLLMGGFVAIYNYFGFRLLAPPFGLRQAVVGLVSLAYLPGVASSMVIGRLVDRVGARRLLMPAIGVMLAGVLLTLSGNLAVVLAGLALLTAAFFAAHSLASGMVALQARGAPAQASALYLFSYYVGASVVGTAGGVAWHALRWGGVVTVVGLVVAAGLVVARRGGRGRHGG